MAKLKNINDLQNLIQSLALNKVQAKRLNMTAGNVMRKIIRANLKNQKDIKGKTFEARKKMALAFKNNKVSAKKRMFGGATRFLNQDANDDGVAVGFSDQAAKIFEKHNFGKSIKFKQSNGKYVRYQMPKREFLGWNKEMIKQVETAVVDQYLNFRSA